MQQLMMNLFAPHKRINDNKENEGIGNLIHFVAKMIALSGYHGSTRMPLWEESLDELTR